MSDESKDDRLFNDFLTAQQQMDASKAQDCLQSMSDEGLVKATFKINDLAKNDPGYMISNIFLMSEFTNRPHLKNPFAG
jgi:hypothetical protein